MNVVYVYADTKEEWNCSEWRCSIPVRAIRRTKRHDAALISILDFVNPKGRTEALLEAADVIVVQRNLFGPVLQAIRGRGWFGSNIREGQGNGGRLNPIP